MAYISSLSVHEVASQEPKHGLLWHLMQALAATRMQQADREIAASLARSGGKFTDESEREIERRLTDGRHRSL